MVYHLNLIFLLNVKRIFMKLKTNQLKLLVVALGISLLISCNPYDPVYIDELDLTVTTYDTEVDFSQYNTFVIRDSTGLIHNYLSGAQEDEFYEIGGTSEQVREYVRTRFLEMGYTEADTITEADFAINNVVLKLKTTYLYYPGWWYGYPGYWPGYGWGPEYPGYHPPYYPGYSYYSTYEGTILTEMIDAESVINAGDEAPIHILWQAFINGGLSNNLEYMESRVKRGYDEAFEQSPYLN
jgi:hypothetical protein